jgi:spore germination cell wall hydrolase CwlJ-like protein
MSKTTNDAISRSDRVLVAAMAIVLATASAAVGASLTYHPHQEKPVVKPVVQVAEVPKPATDAVMNQLLEEHKCLSEALYYEARGEGQGGQKAVAEVVFHRMNHGNFGHSICAVVYEGKEKPGCQFSFACDAHVLKAAKRPEEWRQAELLAAQILTGQVALKNSTGGALNYHAVSASPEWAETMDRTTQIGNHVFYRGMPKPRES